VDRRESTGREVPAARDDLERQVRQLQERLTFYEGFDQLIQENVGRARDLFRKAAEEREAAAADAARIRQDAERQAATNRAELAFVADELRGLAAAVETLSRRVADALESDGATSDAAGASGEQRVALVIHGIPSAESALSLQRFVAALPQVVNVSAREFAGGLLRLDARVRERLTREQFTAWEGAAGMRLLTNQPDVLEMTLDTGSAEAAPAG
jgi:hypothetical protein